MIQGAEGSGNVLGESGAGGGVHGLWGRKAFEVPESVEGLDKFLGIAEDGDEVGLETGTGSLAKFSSWPSKSRAGWESFFGGRLKEALKKIPAGLRPVRAIQAMPFWR